MFTEIVLQCFKRTEAEASVYGSTLKPAVSNGKRVVERIERIQTIKSTTDTWLCFVLEARLKSCFLSHPLCAVSQPGLSLWNTGQTTYLSWLFWTSSPVLVNDSIYHCHTWVMTSAVRYFCEDVARLMSSTGGQGIDSHGCFLNSIPCTCSCSLPFADIFRFHCWGEVTPPTTTCSVMILCYTTLYYLGTFKLTCSHRNEVESAQPWTDMTDI